MPSSPTSHSVRSPDGTRIAFDRTGSGPPVVLVEAAGHYRDFTSFTGLVPILAREFTVYTYDRRGRGDSTDTLPYAPDREVEDLEALIGDAGGAAHVYGYSSGALLAMRVAAQSRSVTRLALLEPPLQDDDAVSPDPLTAELGELIRAGRKRDAVDHFHRSIGVPPDVIADMRPTPEWAKMASVAHTLVYDCTISDTTSSGLMQAVLVPTLVLDSAGSTDDLSGSATRVASQLPNAIHRSLPGEWHGVADDLLGPVLVEFFRDEPVRDDVPVKSRSR